MFFVRLLTVILQTLISYRLVRCLNIVRRNNFITLRSSSVLWVLVAVVLCVVLTNISLDNQKMSESQLTRFYNNFLFEEPLLLQTVSVSNDSDMNLTPSPSASSMSETFSPAQSEETEVTNMSEPYLHIVEQPVTKFRFRYRSEMQGAHGSLLGRNETARKKSFPAVELRNYDGDDAVIRCLLYTATDPPVPHMHQLIGKENNREILDHEVVVSDRNGYRAEFKGLGIVHVSKKDLKKELLRKKENCLFEQLRRDEQLVDFDDEALRDAVKSKHQELELKAVQEAKTIDPNKVKLCFQAFVRGPRGEVHYLCQEVFSETIQNMKSAETGDLKICRIDKYAGSCNGGEEICILVEKVCKKNIQVRFYELDEDGQEVWSDLGLFGEHDVHHQYAIVFRTPRYRKTDIQVNVPVKVELVRPKDKARSEPISFHFKPVRRCAKRVLSSRSFSSSDSCSSLEAPYKIYHQIGDEDPLLSGQSLSSLSFPSDTVNKVLEEIASENDDANIINQFAEFLFSDNFPAYSGTFAADKIGHEQMVTNQTGSPIPCLPSPLEAFGQCEFDVYEFNSCRTPNLPPLKPNTSGGGDIIVTDGIGKKGSGERKGLKILESVEQSKEISPDDSASMAKEAYGKLLKLMKSRHPSRLQDMKHIIRAEDQDYGPLHAAVIHRQLKELSDLLSLIIKSNLLKLINSPSRRNQTPLMVAVEENNLDSLKLLCMAKADLNYADDKGDTAFHIASKFKHSECMRMLLSGGPIKGKFELDRKNDEGETALHIAVRQKDLKNVEFLVNAGADLNSKTGTAGQTPLHLAVEAKSKDIIEYLLGREKIRPEELNFRKQMAEDLVHSDQKDIMSLFMAFHGIELEEREDDHVDENVGVNEGLDEDESDLSDEDEGDEVRDEVDEMRDEEELEDNKSDGKSQPNEDDFSVLDKITIDKIAQQLDEGKKWTLMCKELKVDFLIQTFAVIPSPTRCLIRYLECEKKTTLSEFRAALMKVNVPVALEALDNALKNNSS